MEQLIPLAGAIAQLGVAGIVILGFLLLLSYPPLLATGPAIDWLRTVGRLEKR